MLKRVFFVVFLISIFSPVFASDFPSDSVSVAINIEAGGQYTLDQDFFDNDCYSVMLPCVNIPVTKTVYYVKAKRETPINTNVPVDDSYVLAGCLPDAGHWNYIEIDRESFPESEWYGSDHCTGSIFVQNTDSMNQARVWITYLPYDSRVSTSTTVSSDIQFGALIYILALLLFFVSFNFWLMIIKRIMKLI